MQVTGRALLCIAPLPRLGFSWPDPLPTAFHPPQQQDFSCSIPSSHCVSPGAASVSARARLSEQNPPAFCRRKCSVHRIIES